ncbi:helix-turn-helix transcriptional regulator [Synechococcus sp. PCC 7336]|uniref:S24 family peptidase n=1 Tax=Synechococcus sp. PCC 7336 TaxID=195250 RepID=UPI0005715F14|nr:helix-turn-helix transcriptional regulator [Synechococcus sp. PCC 7336]
MAYGDRLKAFAVRLRQAIGDEAVYAFGKRAGLSDTSLRSYLKGTAVPGIDKAIAIAETAAVSLQWLIAGEGPMQLQGDGAIADSEDYVCIPLVDAEASAGAGILVREEDITEAIAFERQWLRSKLGASPAGLSLITVNGDSMAPTLVDGDTIFVDRQVSELRDGIYVFQMDGDLLVKRLQKLPGSLVSVISDNPKFPPFTIDMNSSDKGLTIIGRYRGRISFE